MKCKKRLNFVEISGSSTITPDGKFTNNSTPAIIKRDDNNKASVVSYNEKSG
jgi:hypothetical protein